MLNTRKPAVMGHDMQRLDLRDQIERIAKIVCDRKKIHDIDLKLLRNHGAIGLVYHHTTSSELKKSLKAFALEQIASEKMRSVSTGEMLNALHNDFGLDFIVFKGGALAYQHYQEPWLRPRTDTDILISKESKPAFHRALNSLEMQKLPAAEGSQISQQMSYGKLLNGKSTINLDVHWKISNRHAVSNVLDFEEIQENSTTFKIGDTSFRCPSNVHALVLACVHRSGHHYNEERFTWLYDIHLLCASLSKPEWQQILKITKEKQISFITLDALARCQELLNTKVPYFVLEELRMRPMSDEISAELVSGNLTGWKIFWNDFRALADIKDKFIFVWQTAFPSIGYMREKYSGAWLITAYLKRAWSGLRKWV